MNLNELHLLIKPQIEAKRIAFCGAGWIAELIFCLCTPQTNAKKAWAATESIMAGQTFSDKELTASILKESGVRFSNNKAQYIYEATREPSLQYIRQTIQDTISPETYIRWKLHLYIKGYGLKETSHFLRNIGKGESLCILDRHILRSLKEQNVIDEIPKTLDDKAYLEIEQKMLEFSEKMGIPPFDLDFVFWHQSHGELFK